MLQAQSSMTAAKLLSATLPLPLFLRKSRMADGAASVDGGTGAGAKAAGGLGRMGGTVCDDLESCSSVMRVEDTILFFQSVSFYGSIVIALMLFCRDEKSAARILGWKFVRQLTI
jgi:hypothetical protein